jgi:hypothetical protein
MAGRLKPLVAQSMRSIRFAARAKGEVPCTLEESLARISQAKVVYFGERHHNSDILKVCAVTESSGARNCPLTVFSRPLVHLPEGTVWVHCSKSLWLLSPRSATRSDLIKKNR